MCLDKDVVVYHPGGRVRASSDRSAESVAIMEGQGMRIVLTTMFDETSGGGIGRVSWEIAPALAKRHHVLLIHHARTTRLSKPIPSLTLLQLRSSGEVFSIVPYFGLESIKALFRFLAAFDPDVIHAQDLSPVSLLTQIWATAHNVPFIYTSHILASRSADFDPVESPRWLIELAEKTLLKGYYTDFLSHCDAVIVLNEKGEEDMMRYGYKGKIFRIPNGRHLALYAYPLPSIAEQEKRLLFVGDLCHRKNQRYLLEVMRHLPSDFVLDLVGAPLQASYSRQLYKYAQENGLKVNFVGKVDHSVIPAYLQKAHLFISASTTEVQSLAVLEALASGTPVIGLSNETIDEFADGIGCICLPKGTSPAQFAEKILDICRLPQEHYARLCEDAKSRVAHLDWDAIAQRTTEVYAEIIKLKKEAQAITKESALLKLRAFRKTMRACFYLGLMTVASAFSDAWNASMEGIRDVMRTSLQKSGTKYVTRNKPLR